MFNYINFHFSMLVFFFILSKSVLSCYCLLLSTIQYRNVYFYLSQSKKFTAMQLTTEGQTIYINRYTLVLKPVRTLYMKPPVYTRIYQQNNVVSIPSIRKIEKIIGSMKYLRLRLSIYFQKFHGSFAPISAHTPTRCTVVQNFSMYYK